MAKVTLTRGAADDLEDMPLVIHSRILVLLERLAKWPAISGAKPLSGKLARRFRLRTGDYRVQFRIEQGAVVVEKIGHRDHFYD